MCLTAIHCVPSVITNQYTDHPGSGLVPRWICPSFRVLVGVSFVCYPLYNNTSPVFGLLLCTSDLPPLCLAETLGKIGTVGNDAPTPQKFDGYGYPGITLPILPKDAEASLPTCRVYKRKEIDDVITMLDRRTKLTAYNKVEEDVGGDSHVGVMRAITVRGGERVSAISFVSLKRPD